MVWSRSFKKIINPASFARKFVVCTAKKCALNATIAKAGLEKLGFVPMLVKSLITLKVCAKIAICRCTTGAESKMINKKTKF